MSGIEHVMEFKPDGTAQCLHTDNLPLRELGKLSMQRASRIEWNDNDQAWIVLLDVMPIPQVLYAADSRADCLAWEREYFNRRILEG